MKLSVQCFLVALLAIISLFSCQEKDAMTRYVIDDEVSYLLLGSEVTKEELQDIASEFKSIQDIDIDFDGTIYDTEGRVVKLNLKVATKNGEGEITNASTTSAGFFVDEHSFRISNNLRI